ncbi:hypothetical protein As57867_006824, partial [Aphanomyces stellatus]
MVWSCSTYWDIHVPMKSPIEEVAEQYLFVLRVGHDSYVRCCPVVFTRWWLLLAAFATHFASGLVFGLTRITGSSPSGLLFHVCVALSVSFTGPYIERDGPRMGLTFGSILIAVGCGVSHIAVIKTDPVLLALGHGVFCAVGVGFVIVAATGATQKWFPDLRGCVSGLCAASFTCGILSLVEWMPHIDGLTNMFWIAGTLAVGLLTLSAMVFRTPPASFRINGVDMHGVPDRLAPPSARFQNNSRYPGLSMAGVFQCEFE